MKSKQQNPAPKICPECNGRLSDSSPAGPCPACLMQLGMQTWQQQRPATGKMDPTAHFPTNDQSPFSMDEIAKKFSQFEILHEVGQGGMGVVYCARQKSLGRLVALKVIRPQKAKRAEFADRFSREARAMATLNHPNILQIHDFGEVDDLYYLSMEYVDGINLRQMIRGNRLTSKQALEIVPAICDALQYAHDHGIVHRDIKPENIMIDTEGRVKIADFGLAKLLDKESAGPTLTRANHIMGTMHYMAPEQIETPLTVDHRADIYSLGVVIYELLTGELPLGRFEPPSHKVSIDVRLDEIVLQTLAKEPARRYQHVSDVKSDVQSVACMENPAALNPAASVGVRSPKADNLHGETPLAPTRQLSRMKGPIPEAGLFAMLRNPQSYKNLAYMFLTFPLGVIYFSLLVTGFSAGLGTLVVWIGVPVLLGTLLFVRGALQLERGMTRLLLNTDIPKITFKPLPAQATLWDRVKNLATCGRTWQGVFYLLTKFPLGIMTFVGSTVLFAIPFSLMASPALLAVFGVEQEINDWSIDTQSEAGAAAIVGLVLLPFSIAAINGIAWVNAQWAKLVLR